MTKQLKLKHAVNPWSKWCNVNWSYCKKPSQKYEKIASLEKKVDDIDSNIVVLESQHALANHVSDVLHKKFGDQEQYSRRLRLAIEGIRICENETEAFVTKSVFDIIKSDLQFPDIAENNVDKCYRIWPIYDDGS